MTKDITPKIDIAFKKIFGVDENKDLLISLINAVVSEEDQVSKVTLLNPYNPKNFLKDKLSVVDIKAEGQTGKRYNIEIQVANEGDYDKRALYYWAKLYMEQLGEGDFYDKLNKAIGIHILNFTSVTGTDKYHNTFHVLEKDSHIRHFDHLELHTIELNKFNDMKGQAQGWAEETEAWLSKAKTSLDAWVTFLARHKLFHEKNLPSPLNAPCFQKALKVLGKMTFTDEEREAYEGKLKWLRIEASALKKMGEESEARGIEQGIEQGERKKAVAVAKTLLKKGIDIAIIAEASGLSVDELQQLQQEPSPS